MTDQLSLFSIPPQPVQPPRQDAIDAAYDAALEEFKTMYETLLMTFARSGRQFTGEEVTDAYKASGHVQPKEWRATGSIYQRLSRQGVIVRVGYAPRNQGNPTPVYKGKADA